MECKKVREFILTDYSDGEVSEGLHREISVHLKACPACTEFQRRVSASALKPFKAIEPVEPPVSVWHNIREAIREEERGPVSVVDRLMDMLERFMPLGKPVTAFGGVIAVMLILFFVVGVPMKKREDVNAYVREQAAFMLGSAEQDVNFGTAIEKYLL